ncbi:phosphoinositide phosphatase SAC6-like [Gossypium australe]|uniref:Phosphoinositide phosphatase SAC6-like n=1 Tax=Gossypium australe TaxID=47621 RepID=A0A5B6WEC3_9ROSI|nr:phosphoinositide phosphatase SAC6-like [Gossypium australe]
MKEKAEPVQKLYTRMRLWEFPDEYVIEPTDGSSASSSLSISQVDASMKLIDSIPECSSFRVPKIQMIFGVVGMLKLVAGSYLFVITERKCVGSYLGHLIFKVISLKVLPCVHSVKNSTPEQKKVENEFSRLLKVAERTTGLYFSYDTNLTLSTQRLYDLGNESKMLPLWRQAEPRFLWNSYMLEALIDKKLDPYLLPVVQGSFHNFQATIGKEIVDVTLIARRCTRRNGDEVQFLNDMQNNEILGQILLLLQTFLLHASLTVTTCILYKEPGCGEEELILWGTLQILWKLSKLFRLMGLLHHLSRDLKSSLHEVACTCSGVRGSIPFLWEQIVDLTYKPKFEIVRPEEAPQIAERHFLDLRKMYGSVLAVDLLNKHGGEGRLSDMFSNAMQPIVSEDLRYLHFDFTKICGHVHFERLSFLYDQIADFLVKNGYFLLNEESEKMEQLGVVRTNCIDCLDRTNITQSMIARKILELQLRRIGVFAAEETISSHPKLDRCFRILWANHGDGISIQYSGTAALKGDLVRSGQRRVQGILKDRYISLKRYYLNNFSDGTKQDAIDLLQGHYKVSVGGDITPPSQTGGLEAIALIHSVCAVLSASFVFGIDRVVIDNNVIGASFVIHFLQLEMIQDICFSQLCGEALVLVLHLLLGPRAGFSVIGLVCNCMINLGLLVYSIVHCLYEKSSFSSSVSHFNTTMKVKEETEKLKYLAFLQLAIIHVIL